MKRHCHFIGTVHYLLVVLMKNKRPVNYTPLIFLELSVTYGQYRSLLAQQWFLSFMFKPVFLDKYAPP